MRKKGMIISKVNVKMRKKSHKYGLEVPMSVEGAYQIDLKNGNVL